MKSKNLITQNLTLLIILLFGVGIYNLLPQPISLTAQGWHLLIIFLCTIAGIISNALPMGAVAALSILACTVTNTLTLSQCLSGFADEIVWLVVLAFFISYGFVKTRLGSRIAYLLILKLGQSSLGIAYSLVFADFLLSPAIPSVSARGGGILYPIANSLCSTYTDDQHHGASNKNRGFFMKICAQSTVITSAMFLTAMAANPVAVKVAALAGVDLTWGQWALAAFVPGLICLCVMPLFIYYLYPPSIKHSNSASQLAKEKLDQMGSLSWQEGLMLLIFVLLIFLWISGKALFGINATTTALIGFCLLLIFRLVEFEEVIDNKSVWHIFFWFGTLLMLSSFLANLGVMNWLGIEIERLFVGFSSVVSIILLSLAYFFIHYLFASATAHMTVLMPTFLAIFINIGMPPKLSVLMLTFLSILSSGLTHFGLSSTPIFYGASGIKISQWWRLGLIMSFVYLGVWSSIGAAWWKAIGIW